MKVTGVRKVIFIRSVAFKTISLLSLPADVPFLFIEVCNVTLKYFNINRRKIVRWLWWSSFAILLKFVFPRNWYLTFVIPLCDIVVKEIHQNWRAVVNSSKVLCTSQAYSQKNYEYWAQHFPGGLDSLRFRFILEVVGQPAESDKCLFEHTLSKLSIFKFWARKFRFQIRNFLRC